MRNAVFVCQPLVWLVDKPVTLCRSLGLFGLMVGLIVPVPNLSAQVQDQISLTGILVSGEGIVMVKPQYVEMQFGMGIEAKVAADAMVKYQNTRKQAVEAFQKLNLPNLTLEESGLVIGTGESVAAAAVRLNQGQNVSSKEGMQVGRTLTVRLHKIDELAETELVEAIGQMIDTAKDNGLEQGDLEDQQSAAVLSSMYGRSVQDSSLHFVSEDLESAREQAYAAAAQSARQRAERLANLHGLQLGNVLAVYEESVSGEGAEARSGAAATLLRIYGQSLPEKTPNKPRLISGSLSPMPFRVKLSVRFATIPQNKAADNKKAAE